MPRCLILATRPLAVAAICCLPAAAPGAGPQRVKIAVMDVRNVQGVAEGTSTILSDIIVSEVAKARFEVISKSDIAAMVGFEKEKQMLGCSDDSKCLAEIGGALGVDYMLTGQVGQIGTRYRISLLLVDSKKAKVAARSAQFCDRNEDALAAAAQATVTEILAAVPRPEAPAPQAPAPAAAPLAARPTAPRPVAAAPPPAAAVTAEAGPNRTGAWIAYGVSGGLIVIGAIAGLSAQAKYKDLEKQQGTAGYQALWDAQAPDIRKLARAADGCFVLGAIGVGVGTWLWLAANPAEPRKIAVAPLVGDGQVGLVAAGQF
jgi:TolB-like protein